VDDITRNSIAQPAHGAEHERAWTDVPHVALMARPARRAPLASAAAVPSGPSWSGLFGDRGWAAVTVGGLGLALIIADGVMLSTHGTASAAIGLVAVLAASTLSSIAGFAFSALCGALLFHLLDDHIHVVQIMIVCSIAMQSLSVAALWRSIDWRSLPVFLLGGILGVPAGVYLLLHLQGGVYRGIIGALLVAYGSYLVLRRRVGDAPLLRGGALADACAGFLGGITGGLVGFPGAAVTIWCSHKGWDKARQRGVYQPFILCMQPVALIAINLMLPSSPADAPPFDWTVVAFVPAALLGTWFGLHIFKRLSDRQFELAVNTLLIVSGIALII